MNEDYFSKKGKEPARRDAADRDTPQAQDDTAKAAAQRNYMTVGSGSTSEHASRLVNMLEQDSGYGGSAPDEDHPGMAAVTSGRPQPRHQTGAIHQMWYNSQRSKLSRSINLVLELLDSLRDINSVWPAHYPSVQRTEAAEAEQYGGSSLRPGIAQAESYAGDARRGIHPAKLRRSLTSVEDHLAESSRAAEDRTATEPRLVTPQIAQEFSILKLDLKLGALHQAELVHSLEKSSIASLLDGKISSSIKHLLALRDRIADTSSKVLITGDLNAGKSTFCNALLRRKVLPEDQQPCTAIFCEVLDARENAGLEEVHAVHKEAVYNRNDESTYDVYSLKELEQIVIDNEKYTQCKIYVRDSRSIDESLLNNGVVDIALIDAPGLNSDTTKTTAIFARQEEIDVVVFVLSAANHFTQSAQEFIWAAAAEKAYIFIVVNGFDFIRDKERCKKRILDQISNLSPRTHKESSELVHFVSSNAIPAPPGGPSRNGGGSSGGGGGDDGPGDDGGNGKGKDAEKIRDFEALEQSLRRFVLEKRARSKLAPARTYLLNILNDMNTLSTVNRDVAQAELERVTAELKELEPELESRKKARSEVSDRVDRKIEDTCEDVYEHSRAELTAAIRFAGSTEYDVAYPGFFGAFQYAEDLKEAMLSHIADSVNQVEDYARQQSVKGVNAMKQLGILHVGDEFKNLNFRSDVMFRRKKDALAREVHIPTEFLDFFDWSTLVQRQEKYAGTGMALTVAGAVVPRMIGMSTWMDQALAATRLVGNENLRHLIIPGIVLAAFAASAYVVQQIPNSLPRRLAAKISAQLTELDYVHANSARITTAVRRVLRVPADNLRVGLEQTVKDLDTRREETIKVKGESEKASDFFRTLVKRSGDEKHVLEAMDLDAPPPGVD